VTVAIWGGSSRSASRFQLISRSNISTPKTNAELKDLGFTKLVKRDDGVYENVTQRDGDSRYMERGKKETIPDLSKTISS
jgi:hypothetical protein